MRQEEEFRNWCEDELGGTIEEDGDALHCKETGLVPSEGSITYGRLWLHEDARHGTGRTAEIWATVKENEIAEVSGTPGKGNLVGKDDNFGVRVWDMGEEGVVVKTQEWDMDEENKILQEKLSELDIDNQYVVDWETFYTLRASPKGQSYPERHKILEGEEMGYKHKDGGWGTENTPIGFNHEENTWEM